MNILLQVIYPTNVDSLIIYTKQLNKPIQVDNLLLPPQNQKTGLKIPVYMQVRAYRKTGIIIRFPSGLESF